jgi:hypothetical protein
MVVIPLMAGEGGVRVQIDVTLCNHAEAVNNLLYVSGGGINVVYVQPGQPAPYLVSIGIGMLVTVPWMATNQQHKVQIRLLNEDGQPVQLPVAPDVTEPLQLEMAFNVGRPPHLQPGDDQLIALAANLAGLPVPAAGKYLFEINVDGNPERRLSVRVQPNPAASVTFGG